MPSEAATLDIDIVDGILRTYAEKAVFKGYARLEHNASMARYRVRWTYERVIEVTLDRKRQVISFPDLLPSVDIEPALERNLRAFLRAFADMPEHRRVDETRAKLTLRKKDNALTLSIRSLDGDLDYACRKLVHIASEVLLIFLGPRMYDTYKMEGLGVDPEVLWA